jgi:hypothetical protein
MSKKQETLSENKKGWDMAQVIEPSANTNTIKQVKVGLTKSFLHSSHILSMLRTVGNLITGGYGFIPALETKDLGQSLHSTDEQIKISLQGNLNIL